MWVGIVLNIAESRYSNMFAYWTCGHILAYILINIYFCKKKMTTIHTQTYAIKMKKFDIKCLAAETEWKMDYMLSIIPGGGENANIQKMHTQTLLFQLITLWQWIRCEVPSSHTSKKWGLSCTNVTITQFAVLARIL